MKIMDLPWVVGSTAKVLAKSMPKKRRAWRKRRGSSTFSAPRGDLLRNASALPHIPWHSHISDLLEATIKLLAKSMFKNLRVGRSTFRVAGEGLLGNAQQLSLILLGRLIHGQPLLERIHLL